MLFGSQCLALRSSLPAVLGTQPHWPRLLLQVAAAEAALNDLQLDLSSSRVAGCFMLTNLPELQQLLLAVQAQLQAVSQHECRLGVQQQLTSVQQLQQDMLGTVQVGPVATTVLLIQVMYCAMVCFVSIGLLALYSLQVAILTATAGSAAQ